jgi:hypothetical protein
MKQHLPSFIYNLGTPKNIVFSAESAEYDACDFLLNDLKVKYRTAKSTPKKFEQFVTLWKRSNHGAIEPYDFDDSFDVVVIKLDIGYFRFSKSVLLQHDILSSKNTSGKRAFRVYSPHDINLNKQAMKTQNWQKKYYHSI